MIASQASYLRDRSYMAASLNHFFVDVLNNSRTLLVAVIAVGIGLSNAEVGIALLLYNIGSALTQPIFGSLADRFGPRKLVLGGMGWMILLYAVAALASDWAALAALTLAGLGSGAVHPAGTMVASEASRSSRTQATAFFFTAGQVGLFAGPVLAGFALQGFGRPGYIILPVLALAALAAGWYWLGNGYAGQEQSPPAPAPPIHESGYRGTIPWREILPLTAIIVTFSTIGIAAINYAPKLFTEMGYEPSYVGWIAGLFMLGSAAGGLIGGRIADRVGRRPAILVGMLGAILPLYFYIPVEGPWRAVLLLLTGLFAGMPHSVLVIAVQGLLPGRRAFASGLILGLLFFSGAIGSFLLGLIADRVGLAAALQGTVILPATVALLTLFLPATDH
jgi:MFS transporter, FSR family, fosmidomycin resistance protein